MDWMDSIGSIAKKGRYEALKSLFCLEVSA